MTSDIVLKDELFSRTKGGEVGKRLEVFETGSHYMA
jgi:hypothetical protein